LILAITSSFSAATSIRFAVVKSTTRVEPVLRKMRVSSIGSIRSVLKRRADAPLQGSEGAPDAWLDVMPEVADGLQGLTAGDEIILLTWLHKSQRNILKTTLARTKASL
jgi:tRNA (Thr-GGU) A37 N-methylase